MGRHLGPLLIALAAPSALAYPTPVDFDGSILRWDIDKAAAPIRLEIVADRQADLSLFSDAVLDSAQIWTDVPTSYFAYTQAAEGESAQVTVNLESAIDGGSYSAGYAIFDEFDTNAPPRPKHCSIFVAITDDQSYLAISKTILHELGHCLGLGHTLIPEAIMSYSLDKNGYGLDVDDEAAVTRLYPQDGSKPKLPPGCSVGAHGSPGHGVWLGVLALSAPLWTLARRRASRRTPGEACVEAHCGIVSASDQADQAPSLPTESMARTRA
jgi:hypothetical protein